LTIQVGNPPEPLLDNPVWLRGAGQDRYLTILPGMLTFARMKILPVARLLFGSILVYIIMAACSAAPQNPGFVGSSGPVAKQTQGDGSTVSTEAGQSVGQAMMDALTDPVTTASADPYQSGSRLKAKYYAGSDGSKEFVGWYDSMLSLDCIFLQASDNTTRCLPAYYSLGGAAGAASTLVEASSYADAACTQLVYSITTCAGSPQYILETVSQTMDGSACTAYTFYRVLLRGSPVTLTQTFSKTATGCSAATTFTAPSTFYSVGNEVSPSNFVQATTQTEP
jgi:hypothetical protein